LEQAPHEDKAYLTSVRVNTVFIAFAAVVSVVNVTALAFTMPLEELATSSLVFFPIIGLLLFLAIHRRGHLIQAVTHVVFIYAVSLISIVDTVDNIYGLGFAIVGTYLMYRYRFFDRHPRVKAVIILGILTVTIMISASVNEGWAGAILTLSFLIFVSTIFLYAELDWISRYRSARATAQEAQKLVGVKRDLVEAGLSPREIQVVHELVTRKTTDKEIAYLLGIKTDTVRNHQKSIRKKLGVASKVEIIEASRWYITTHMEETRPLPVQRPD
jgi:DNA-binding CsgD family transcriptional regulator